MCSNWGETEQGPRNAVPVVILYYNDHLGICLPATILYARAAYR